MKKYLYSIFAGLCVAGSLYAERTLTMEETYATREIPAWFNEAKFGIFVVCGPYSVPAYVKRGYAEWYMKGLEQNGDTIAYHNRVYGQDFEYEQFAEMLTADLWDPDYLTTMC